MQYHILDSVDIQYTTPGTGSSLSYLRDIAAVLDAIDDVVYPYPSDARAEELAERSLPGICWLCVRNHPDPDVSNVSDLCGYWHPAVRAILCTKDGDMLWVPVCRPHCRIMPLVAAGFLPVVPNDIHQMYPEVTLIGAVIAQHAIGNYLDRPNIAAHTGMVELNTLVKGHMYGPFAYISTKTLTYGQIHGGFNAITLAYFPQIAPIPAATQKNDESSMVLDLFVVVPQHSVFNPGGNGYAVYRRSNTLVERDEPYGFSGIGCSSTYTGTYAYLFEHWVPWKTTICNTSTLAKSATFLPSCEGTTCYYHCPDYLCHGCGIHGESWDMCGECGQKCSDCCTCQSYDDDYDDSDTYSVGDAVQHWDLPDTKSFDLVQAAAKFYWLQHMSTLGQTYTGGLYYPNRNPYRARLAEYSEELAPIIARYLDMAIGGEIRYAPRMVYNYDRSSTKWEILVDAIEKQSFMDHGGGRNTWWYDWKGLREEMGTDLLADVVTCFNEAKWDGSFGGKNWGKVAWTLLQYETGKIPAAVFIDMAFDLQHNTGCIFNKLWRVTGLSLLLDNKAQYSEMVVDGRPTPLAQTFAQYLVGKLDGSDKLSTEREEKVRRFVTQYTVARSMISRHYRADRTGD